MAKQIVKKDNINNSLGFTLIELAIVLVIVGLLIGAILTAKDLTEQAKINGSVSDIKKITTAYFTFKDKYKCVPGDCAKIKSYFPTQCSTYGYCYTGYSGDGFIQQDGNYFNDEFHLAMLNLSLAGLYADGLTVKTSWNANNPEDYFPPGRFETTYYSFGVRASGATTNMVYTKDYYNTNALMVGTPQMAWAGGQPIEGLTPRQAYGIDSKIDDGNPTMGKTLGIGWGSDQCAAGLIYTSPFSASAVYNVTVNTTICMVRTTLE